MTVFFKFKPVRFYFQSLSLCLALSAFSLPGYAQSTANDYIQSNYVDGFKKMTQQLGNLAMQHMAVLGRFFDAEQQLDTRLDYQRLSAEAHKDYHPSDTMCRFGSFTRSIARTDSKADADKLTLNDMFTSTNNNLTNAPGSFGPYTDLQTRIGHFKKTYCNPADYNGALETMCAYNDSTGSGVGAADKNRINNDIDFARVIDQKLTINLNMIEDPAPGSAASSHEEDVYMLGRNLYWPESLPELVELSQNAVRRDFTSRQDGALRRARALLAAQGVAQNTYINHVSQKASAAEGEGANSGWNFMKTLMRDFNLSDDEINAALGEFPSYYAQMDVLTKKMYQSPNFYTNLYDKPANVERISTSMEAIRLMQMRDHYKSVLRREMLLSAMLANQVNKPVRDVKAMLR